VLDLSHSQLVLVALVFVWSGFVRSGLGFGGAVLSLPFLLLIDNRPLVYLPIISVHLLVFSSAIWIQNHYQRRQGKLPPELAGGVDWAYLKKAMVIMIIPKLIGVLGLLTLPADVMSRIIFVIVGAYAISYIINRPFTSQSKWLDRGLLVVGAYVSGTSLIGAPLIMIVFARHVSRFQLRDTLFALWFILVLIKLSAFIVAGVDLQWIHHTWLLPCAAIGHFVGLRFHAFIMRADQKMFFRVLGLALLLVSALGLWKG
jgi:uncharacterized membrane protein YfcA